MNTFKAKSYLLKGKIQNYAWGTKNNDAFIPQFLDIPTERDKPYAELWMGIHPNAPSEILVDGKNTAFDELIKRFPDEILGNKVSKNFESLPFLFKVLSAGQALSIQAHPNKKQAIELHAKDPEHYPDDNHKPEIAIALSNLTALAGFKTFDQLTQILQSYPEIAFFIGEDIVSEMNQSQDQSKEQQKPLLKKMYSSLMKKSLTDNDELLKAIENLDTRLKLKNELTATEEKFFELRKIYPGADSGLFSLFLLNMIHLKQGQGIFLKAGLPHAYLKGNIVECMANSDNVVRAGLTPKFQDIDTLVEILTYETTLVEILQGEYKKGELVYNTPVSEFQISRIDMNENSVDQKTAGLQILLITEGRVTISWSDGNEEYIKGQSVLVPANLNTYKIECRDFATIFKVIIP